jgi:hypothetical protein
VSNSAELLYLGALGMLLLIDYRFVLFSIGSDENSPLNSLNQVLDMGRRWQRVHFASETR